MQGSLFEIKGAPVNGARVKQARELRGLTQASLADFLYVDQTFVAHIERGTRQPTVEVLEAMAELLRLPTAFFRQQDSMYMQKGSLLFRAKAVVGRKVVESLYQHSCLAVEFATRLSEYANLVPVRVPHLTDPIEGAQQVRELMDVGKGPISDLLRHIERLGVLIIPLLEARDCDGFATWTTPRQDLPIIAISMNFPSDRMRLTAAHELGHLILHRKVNVGTKETEAEAYLFAAELLMPADIIGEDLRTEKVTLFRLAELKSKWHVSMQALARRARELQVLSDRQYRYLMMQLSQKGWRTEEPTFKALPEERPRALRKLAEVALGEQIDWDRRAAEFNLSPSFIRSLLDACAGSPTQKPLASSPNPPENRIVSFPQRK